MTREQLARLADAAFALHRDLEAAELDDDTAPADRLLDTFLRAALPLRTVLEVEQLHFGGAVEVAGTKTKAAALIGTSRRHIYNALSGHGRKRQRAKGKTP